MSTLPDISCVHGVKIPVTVQQLRVIKVSAINSQIHTTNETVNKLNADAREYLKANGTLLEGKVFDAKHGKIEVSVGDYIAFTANKRNAGIYNNDIVKVTAIEGKTLHLAKDLGKGKVVTIRLNTNTFKGFRHGYAVTAHKSQGMTVDRAFVLIDSNTFNREMLYVALSRSRGFSQMVANKEILGDLSDQTLSYLKNLPKAKRQAEYSRAFEELLATTLARSGIRETSQTGRSKEEIMKLSPREKMDQLLARAGKGAKRVEKVVEKVSHVAAKKMTKNLKKTIKRSIFKV